MRSASEHLTPVTLELGGKSPALVTRNYPIADAAKEFYMVKQQTVGKFAWHQTMLLFHKKAFKSLL
jgi:coniferyl-aldehyde dehydrogenase